MKISLMELKKNPTFSTEVQINTYLYLMTDTYEPFISMVLCFRALFYR